MGKFNGAVEVLYHELEPATSGQAKFALIHSNLQIVRKVTNSQCHSYYKIDSLAWDDWSSAYGAKSPASEHDLVWPAVSSSLMIVLTIQSSFMAIF